MASQEGSFTCGVKSTGCDQLSPSSSLQVTLELEGARAGDRARPGGKEADPRGAVAVKTPDAAALAGPEAAMRRPLRLR